MLFRVLTLATSVLFAMGLLTQVVVPSILGWPVFSLFRKESRLARAERLRREALDRKKAAEREAETFRVEADAARVDADALDELTRSDDQSKKGTRV